MRFKKVAVLVPPLPEALNVCGNRGSFPALALILIATQLRIECPWIETQIWDGNILNLAQIKERFLTFKPDMVGMSVLTPTVETAIALSRWIKQESNGQVFIVWGNDHASRNWRQTLEHRPEVVDAIAIGDDVYRVMSQIVKQDGRAEYICNVAYRDGEGIRVGLGRKYRMSDLPIPDRSLLNSLEPYAVNYNGLYGKWHGGRYVIPTTINIAKGCAHGWQPGQKINPACLYCDIYDLTLQQRASQQIWSEVRYLYEGFGVTLLNEVCDSFSSFPDLIEELVKTKPADLDKVQWLVYVRTQELVKHPHIVDLLAQLGVIRVNTGIDAGDEDMLRSLRKGNAHGSQTNIDAVRRLKQAGIQVFMSMVLGAPGTTVETLKNDLDHVAELLAIGNVVCVDPSVLLPLPGAPIWEILTDPAKAKKVKGRYNLSFDPIQMVSCFQTKYSDMDLVNTEELCRDFVRYFCKASYEEIAECLNTMSELARKAGAVQGGYGVPGMSGFTGAPVPTQCCES